MEPSAKIEIELSCAVVGWSSGVFNVALDIGEETTVADGVKQIQAKLPFLAKAKTASVIMYLTKACDNDWLEDSDDIRSQLRSKTTTDTIKALLTNHLHPGSLLKDANLRDCPYGRIHLLLDVTQGMFNDAPHAPFSIAFSSRPSPSPLVKSLGAHWDFQNPPSWQDLDKAVRQQYQAWKSQEGVDRTIFACLDGPGMGKSRMLQEFPSL